MKKSLSDLSLEELWKLFPIELENYRDAYVQQYECEARALMSFLGKSVVRVNHIGSSAVKNLLAKPIVDILLEVADLTDIASLIQQLTSHGWLLMSKEITPELKLSFNKGYTEDGFAEKVFHLHVRYSGDWDELYFRDYLREHDDIAQEYAQLKLRLMAQYKYDRDAYTQAKTTFVKKYSDMARAQYRNKYSL